MLLQRVFVFDGLIQGPVKAILGRNGILGAQHHVHGRRPIPALMNAQFALRITKPVDRQKFNYLGPLHRPVPILECCAKKLIELQLLPQPATQPAAPKLPRPTYRQAREDHFANVGSLRRSRSFTVGKEPILSTLTFLLNHFDRAVPALDLGRVQLPKVEYSALHRPSSTEPNTFAKRIVHMLLAILAANMTLQKHRAILPAILHSEKRLGRYTGHFDPTA